MPRPGTRTAELVEAVMPSLSVLSLGESVTVSSLLAAAAAAVSKTANPIMSRSDMLLLRLWLAGAESFRSGFAHVCAADAANEGDAPFSVAFITRVEPEVA